MLSNVVTFTRPLLLRASLKHLLRVHRVVTGQKKTRRWLSKAPNVHCVNLFDIKEDPAKTTGKAYSCFQESSDKAILTTVSKAGYPEGDNEGPLLH